MKFRSNGRLLLIGVFVIAAGHLLPRCANATDCPANAPSCKVITLTPDEEQVLIQPRGILDTAAQARQIDLANLVAYFRAKIDKAPQGDVKAPAADAPKDVPVPTPDPRK